MSTPPSAAALPAALIDRDQWVCWRTQERDDKPTKVPIIPGSTQFASTTNPETWTSFSRARQAVTNTAVDGLGFVFTAADPLVGIDLDDCRHPDADEPTEWAGEVIDDLDSYTEVSPSGTGYHVIVTGDLPAGRNRAGDLEVYDRSRFFTVTGDHVPDTPATIRDRSEVLASLVEAALSPDSQPAPAGETTTTTSDSAPERSSVSSAAAVPISDAELLERARNAANGAKFDRLWGGSTTGYESHSEADLALCRLLAFWTGNEPARIDRLFRDSGLYRDKWDAVHYADGSTYGEKTVERAVAATDDTYSPPETTDTAADEGATAADESPPPSQSATTPADTTHPAVTDSTPAGGSTSPPPAGELTDLPPTHPERAQARRERIAELTDRVEELLEENERLRAELETERERRRELEPTDEASSSGWWPFSTG